MQQQENIPVRKRWDVADIPVQLDIDCTWGIPARYIPAILEKLVALNLVEKADVTAGKIKFNQFRTFVAHLHQNGYNTNELHAAVEKWQNEHVNRW